MTLPVLGVVIVTYNSSDVILDCLETLLQAKGVRLVVAVVDNASPDGTPQLLRDWAAGAAPYAAPGDLPFALDPQPKPLALEGGVRVPDEGHCLALLEAGVNGGFAGGVNHGLAHLAALPELDRFWILNPDCVVHPDTPRATLFAGLTR